MASEGCRAYGKCALLEKGCDGKIDDASLNDNQCVVETLPYVNINMPQSLINDIMNDQKYSDESSSSIESFWMTLDAIKNIMLKCFE